MSESTLGKYVKYKVVHTTFVYMYTIQTRGFENVDRIDPRFCIGSKIMKAHRIINTIFREHLAQFDISNSQLSMLLLLSKLDGLGQQDIANYLFLEKSSLSRNMKRLLQRGLIEKTNGKEITITKNGLTILNEVIPYWENAMAEARKKLKSEGEEALNLLLTNLIHN